MNRRWMGISLVAVAALAGWGWRATTRLPTLAIHATSAEHRATAYLFLSVDCPISRQFVPTLNRLYAEYGPHGIQFLGVYPAASASSDVLEYHRREFEIAFPVTPDPAHELCQKFSATHTPQAIVVGDMGTVLYSGQIDGSFADLGRKRITASRADLGEALRNIVAGREIEVARTTPVGCPIEPLERPEIAAGDLTYCRDVAPILFGHCVQCHRPGEVAPFSLETYESARAHAGQIAIVTGRRLMPPWKPEPHFGQFQNDRRLSREEIAVIQAWVEQGTPFGDAGDLPLPPEFVSGWQLGEPDLIVTLPEDFKVPADGPDVYQHFVLPSGLSENRLVQALEFRPGAPEVVHHALVYYDVTGTARKLDAADPDPGYNNVGSPGFPVSGTLGGWGPGGLPRRLPPGMGRRFLKDADVVLQIHYHPNGKVTRDRSQLGLYFAPPSATWEVTEGLVANVDLEIPAGAQLHLHRASFTVPVETLLLDATPHMHVLGKEIRATAFPPQGPSIPLIWVKDWDFGWQDHYVYQEPVRLPAGTRIDLECWFDNSAGNPLNPHHPPQTVQWGDNSTDEMAICYFQMTSERWDDYVTLCNSIQAYFDAEWNRARHRK